MSVILLYNSPIKSSNVVQRGEFFIAKKKLGLVPTFSLEETKFLKWVLMGHLKNYFSAEIRLYV